MKKRPKTKPKQTERTMQSPQARTNAHPRKATIHTKLAKRKREKRSKENKNNKMAHADKKRGKEKKKQKGEKKKNKNTQLNFKL